jgi:Flp pilus assembly protein TadG
MRPGAPWPTIFLRHAGGVSAVEFALIAPVLLIVFAGSTEISSAIMNERRFSTAVASVGNLTSEHQQVTPATVSNIFAAAGLIMQPFPTTTLALRVSSVTQNASGQDLVDWSQNQNDLAAYAPGTVIQASIIPSGVLVNPGDTVIMAEGTYNYTSPIAYTLPTGLKFKSTVFFHPRFPGPLSCPTC